MNTKYPEIEVNFTEENGNVFNLIAIVRKALKKNNIDNTAFTLEVTEAESYDHALRIMMSWVTVN